MNLFSALGHFWTCKGLRARLRQPARSAAEFIDIIEKNQLPQTAQYLRTRVGLI